MAGHVLIADTEAGIRLLLLEVFESEGYNVTTVTNEQDVLNKLQQSKQDILVIDYHFVAWNDMYIMNEIEKNERHLIVIVIGDLVSQTHLFQLSYDTIKAVIEKPFSIQHLLNVIKKD